MHFIRFMYTCQMAKLAYFFAVASAKRSKKCQKNSTFYTLIIYEANSWQQIFFASFLLASWIKFVWKWKWITFAIESFPNRSAHLWNRSVKYQKIKVKVHRKKNYKLWQWMEYFKEKRKNLSRLHTQIFQISPHRKISDADLHFPSQISRKSS